MCDHAGHAEEPDFTLGAMGSQWKVLCSNGSDPGFCFKQGTWAVCGQQWRESSVETLRTLLER